MVGHLTPNSSTPQTRCPLGEGCSMYKVCRNQSSGRCPGNSGSQGRRPELPPASTRTVGTHAFAMRRPRLRRLPTFPFSPCPVLGPISGYCGRSLLSPEAGFSRTCENLLPTRRKRVSCATGAARSSCWKLPQQLTLAGLMGPAKALRVKTGSLGLPPPWLTCVVSAVWSGDHSSPITGDDVSSALRRGT